MRNLDYWNTFVGEESPESFMRNFGSSDPDLCVSRFLEERGQLYGIVNQGSWVKTFAVPEQHHCLTVRVYLLSYLYETRDAWQPALEANPPHTPRRYREKFDPDRFPPPGSTSEESCTEEIGTYGTYIPDSDHDFDSAETYPTEDTALPQEHLAGSAFEYDDAESSVVTPDFAEADEEGSPSNGDPTGPDVVMPDAEFIAQESENSSHLDA